MRRFNPLAAGCGDCAHPLPSLLFAVRAARRATKSRFFRDLYGGRGPQKAHRINRLDPRAVPPPGARFGQYYKRMNDLSKDAASRVTVGEEAAGQRIDNYLMRLLKGVPKSHIYRILRSGEVRVNKGRVGPDTRLAVGDVVRVPPVRTAEAPTKPAVRSTAKVPVLFEDEHLIVVDKPAGLAVHGGSGIAAGLIEQMRVARPDARFLELVHRLDRETSGVMLLAKKRSALVELHRQLREGEVDKRYLVLVRGRWRDEKRRVRLPLHKFATKEGERRVRVDDETGRQAETIFRRLDTWPDREPPLALLEAELQTGRTHQIRVHLTHLGFPLAGDDKYGDFAWNRVLAKHGLKRMFLHAKAIAFTHPATGEPRRLEAALPRELASFIEGLR
jgi:23S rRNA pseudouridine955/2504/2580 synthase